MKKSCEKILPKKEMEKRKKKGKKMEKKSKPKKMKLKKEVFYFIFNIERGENNNINKDGKLKLKTYNA